MAVSRVEGIFSAKAVKPKYGGIFSAVMQYGGSVLAVGGFSFSGGNEFGDRRYYRNMAVNRHKIPTTTLQKKNDEMMSFCELCNTRL